MLSLFTIPTQPAKVEHQLVLLKSPTTMPSVLQAQKNRALSSIYGR